VRTDRSGYALVVGADDVDAVRFERLADTGARLLRSGRVAEAARALTAATALWRGPALADLSELPFAAAEAVRLEERRLIALEDWLEAEVASGRAGEVIDDISALAREHPFRERLVGTWMSALAREGRQKEALEVFASHRDRLVDELGLEPSSDLQAIQQVILSGDLGSQRAQAQVELPVRRPPTPAVPLVGRSEELDDLVSLLRAPDARLVTLLGAGGIGKTRLATAVAETVGADFEAGACWVPLAALADPHAVLPAVQQALGLADAPDRTPAQAVGDLLARRDLLLVLDNVEHLLPGAATAVANLLAAGAGVRVLATSRAPLRVQGERRYQVAPLPLPGPSDDPAGLEQAPASALFLDRVRRVRPHVELTDESAAAVRTICKRLEGIPLALELAAARCSMLSLPRLAERLEDRLGLLTSGTAAVESHHASMRATVEWSVRLLSPQQQQCLARLAVAPGGVAFDDAAIIADHDRSSSDQLLETLQQLVDASLLQVGSTSGHDRLSMLETVRECALQDLELDPVEAARARQALRIYCLHAVPTRVPPFPATRTEIERLLAEQENVRAGLQSSRDDADEEMFARLALGFAGCASLVGSSVEADAWLEEVAEGRASVSARTAARAMRVILTNNRGGPAQALELLSTLVIGAVDNAAAWQAATEAVKSLSLAATDQQPAQVKLAVDRSLDIATTLGDPWTLSFVRTCAIGAIGVLEPHRATTLMEELLRDLDDISELSRMIAALNLAEAALEDGNVVEAKRWAESARASPIADLLPNLRFLALDLLAVSLILAGDTRNGHRLLQEAAVLIDWADHRGLVAEMMTHFAAAALQEGDPRHARRLLAEYAALVLDNNLAVTASTRTVLRRLLSTLPEAQGILAGDLHAAAEAAQRPARIDLLLRLATGREPLA
jgi:predicted ATPase